MKTSKIYKILALVILAIALVVGGILAFRSGSQQGGPAPSPTPPSASAEGTLVGTTICLPYKPGSTEPQTMECMFGLQTDPTTYYALDTQDLQSEDSALMETSIEVKVAGTIVPADAPNTDGWKDYDIKGIIRVKTFEKIDPTPAPTGADPKVRVSGTAHDQ